MQKHSAQSSTESLVNWSRESMMIMSMWMWMANIFLIKSIKKLFCLHESMQCVLFFLLAFLVCQSIIETWWWWWLTKFVSSQASTSHEIDEWSIISTLREQQMMIYFFHQKNVQFYRPLNLDLFRFTIISLLHVRFFWLFHFFPILLSSLS